MGTPEKSYLFRLTLDDTPEIQEAMNIREKETYISDKNTGQRIPGTIVEITPTKSKSGSQITKIIPYFIKQWKAIFIPFKSKNNLSKFRTISLIYAILSYGVNIGSFFVRGWRLGVIRNMGRKFPIMAPGIQSLKDVGMHLKEGIILIFTKFIYDSPKYFILVVFGYEIIEFLLDLGYWAIQYSLGGETRLFMEYVKENRMVPKLGISFLTQAILFLIYSFLVSPTFKIQVIKFAFQDDWKLFFNWNEFKDSYRIYRSQPRSTIAAYLWGLSVSTVGNIISFFLIIIPIVGLIIIPFYRFLFIHWPKAHAYGGLGRKLIEQGVLRPEKYL